MDFGWITTFGSSERMMVQVSFASEGGSGAPVPDCHEYGPTDEPWGVRRFYTMTRSASSSIFSSTKGSFRPRADCRLTSACSRQALLEPGSILRHLPMAGGGT
jgi:hypothetical protein